MIWRSLWRRAKEQLTFQMSNSVNFINTTKDIFSMKKKNMVKMSEATESSNSK